MSSRDAAFALSFNNPKFMDDYAISHLPQVELKRKNLTKFKNVLRRGIDECHVGKFLVARVIQVSSVTEVTATLALVDYSKKTRPFFLALVSPGFILKKGEPVALDMHEFVKSLDRSVIAIMNPWYSMAKCLRCRNPNHLVVLGLQHPLFDFGNIRPIFFTCCSHSDPTNYLESKIAGVKYFSAGNYTMALACFTKALAECDDIESKGRQYANRAMANLCLHKPDEALRDAEKGLTYDAKNVKLLYRKAKALILLDRYQESVEFLKQSENMCGENDDMKSLLEQGKRSADEFSHGKYDFEKMKEEAKKGSYLDGHAEYFASDRLEMRDIADSRKFLFAKNDIPDGTLLIASKALAYYPKVEVFECELCSMDGKHVHPEVSVESWKQIESLCSSKFSCIPRLFDEFKQMGVFQADKSETVENDLSDEEVLHQEEKLQGTDRFSYGERSDIESFCKENLFTSKDIRSNQNYAGIWLRPSMIKRKNRKANCSYFFIANFLFVRAGRAIKAGEQLFLSHK